MALRANSRRLVDNNPFMRRYIRALGSHVVGPNGMTLQGKYPEVEKLWREFGKKGTPTVCGRYSWLGVERMALRTMALDLDL